MNVHRKFPELTHSDKLLPGDVFKHPGAGEDESHSVYMKIVGSSPCNAVDLEDGSLGEWDSEVILLKGVELIYL